MNVNIYPWYHELYEIEYTCVDLFCVRLKNNKNMVRVFYIYEPEDYVEIGHCRGFYPAKLGNNKLTDGSGLFAVADDWAEKIYVYNIK